MLYIMGLNIFVIQLIYFDNKKSERPIILPKEKFDKFVIQVSLSNSSPEKTDVKHLYSTQ